MLRPLSPMRARTTASAQLRVATRRRAVSGTVLLFPVHFVKGTSNLTVLLDARPYLSPLCQDPARVNRSRGECTQSSKLQVLSFPFILACCVSASPSLALSYVTSSDRASPAPVHRPNDNVLDGDRENPTLCCSFSNTDIFPLS